ncbi:MAG TPA: fatty acid-binding protein DegV, partial [Stenotrophomonas sp.]|nr:fatty acid-binding protein DegV [Stenotrophomonas sp.]
VQKLFGVVGKRVRAGLMTPTVCVSYGGELDELRALPGYAALKETCAAHGVAVYEAVMSLTGMVNVGKGAVTVGFADGPHAFD